MKKLLLTSLLSMTLITKLAFASDLMDVYRQAMISDPVFQSARATYLSATQAYPEARALLLPNIVLNGSDTRNHEVVFDTYINSLARNVNTQQQIVGGAEYNLINYTLQLTQPIISFQNWAQLQVAKAQVKAAAATYAAAAQDLMLRTASAYFDVLQAEDTLRYTEAE